MKRLITLALALVAFLPAQAAEHRKVDLLCTTTPVVMWLPTTAITLTNGYYYTNIFFSNGVTHLSSTGTTYTGVSPYSTNNSNTNIIYGTWSPAIPSWADREGAIPAGALSLDITGAASAVSAVTFYFARSVDGSYYDTNTMWSVEFTPNASATRTVIITNIPAWILTGSKSIQLHKVYSASQGGAGFWSLNKIQVGGWIP